MRPLLTLHHIVYLFDSWFVRLFVCRSALKNMLISVKRNFLEIFVAKSPIDLFRLFDVMCTNGTG